MLAELHHPVVSFVPLTLYVLYLMQKDVLERHRSGRADKVSRTRGRYISTVQVPLDHGFEEAEPRRRGTQLLAVTVRQVHG
jgi:hypothetical protein